MKKALKNALADCYRLLDEGADLEQCLQRYPEIADQLRPELELRIALAALSAQEAVPAGASRRALREALAQEPERGQAIMLPFKTFAKAGALLVGILALGGAAVASGAPTETGLSGTVNQLLNKIGVQDRLPEQAQQATLVPQDDLGADGVGNGDLDPPGGVLTLLEEPEPPAPDLDFLAPLQLEGGPGTGREACIQATLMAQTILQYLADGLGPFGVWQQLPAVAQPGADDRDETDGPAASLEEIRTQCGLGDDGEGPGAGPQDVPGIPEGVQPGVPEGVQPGVPEGVEPGIPEGVQPGIQQGGQPGLPEGIQPGPPAGFQPGLGGAETERPEPAGDDQRGPLRDFQPGPPQNIQPNSPSLAPGRP